MDIVNDLYGASPGETGPAPTGITNGVITLAPLYAAVVKSGSTELRQDTLLLAEATKSLCEDTLRALSEKGVDPNAVELASIRRLCLSVSASYWEQHGDVPEGLAESVAETVVFLGISGETVSRPEVFANTLDIALDINIANDIFQAASEVVALESVQFVATDCIRIAHEVVSTAVNELSLEYSDDEAVALRGALLIAAGSIYRAAWGKAKSLPPQEDGETDLVKIASSIFRASYASFINTLVATGRSES